MSGVHVNFWYPAVAQIRRWSCARSQAGVEHFGVGKGERASDAREWLGHGGGRAFVNFGREPDRGRWRTPE